MQFSNSGDKYMLILNISRRIYASYSNFWKDMYAHLIFQGVNRGFLDGICANIHEKKSLRPISRIKY